MQNSTSIRYKPGNVKGNKETFSCEVKNNDQVTKKELVLRMESEFYELSIYKGFNSMSLFWNPVRQMRGPAKHK